MTIILQARCTYNCTMSTMTIYIANACNYHECYFYGFEVLMHLYKAHADYIYHVLHVHLKQTDCTTDQI